MCSSRFWIRWDLWGLLLAAAWSVFANSNATGDEPVRFQRRAIVDPQVNAPAAWMLVPVGWTYDSSVTWNFQRPACPANISTHAFDPQTGAIYQLFPGQFFCWDVNVSGRYYFGYEIVPGSQNPFQLFDNYIIPRARTSQGCSNLRVVDRQTVSAETDSLGGTQIWARVQIEYACGETSWDEVIYGLFTYIPSGNCVSCTHLNCFAAPQGTLEHHLPTLNTIANSVHLAPGWYTGFRNVTEQLVAGVLQRIDDIGRWSAAFAQEMDQLSDQQFRAWQQRNAAEDLAFQKWTNAFRGVDTYVDGGAHVDLDNSHDAWWSNGLGEYIGTDGHDDPNTWGLNQNWTRLDRAH
jgi:hypothetical protein